MTARLSEWQLHCLRDLKENGAAEASVLLKKRGHRIGAFHSLVFTHEFITHDPDTHEFSINEDGIDALDQAANRTPAGQVMADQCDDALQYVLDNPGVRASEVGNAIYPWEGAKPQAMTAYARRRLNTLVTAGKLRRDPQGAFASGKATRYWPIDPGVG